jgi:hypothetical protein
MRCFQRGVITVLSYPRSAVRVSLLGAFLCWCLQAGCCPTTSQHPLSDPLNPRCDERLLGVWYAGDEREDVYIHVGMRDDGLTEAHVVEHHTGGSVRVSEPLRVFPANVCGHDFLNVVYTSSGLEQSPTTEYILVRYELSGDGTTLSLYSWDERFIDEAIQKDELQGEITFQDVPVDETSGLRISKVSCTRITEGMDGLVHFIRTCGPKRVFNDLLGTFARVHPKGPVPTEDKRQDASPAGGSARP